MSSLNTLFASKTPNKNIKPIKHYIILRGQPTSMSCWSAATGMLLGTRMSVSSGPAEANNKIGLAASETNIASFANFHNLTLHYPQSWSIAGLYALLTKGPIVFMGLVPYGHAFVVSGVVTDGTPKGTVLTIFDPWPVPTGKRYEVNYQDWMQRYPMATMYVLQKG
jgi:hypothetical protein